MAQTAGSQDRALEAVAQAMRALAQANVHLQRAGGELRGEPGGEPQGEVGELTRSMSQQLHFLIGVAELLCYEIKKAERSRIGPKLVLVANQDAEAAGLHPLCYLPLRPEKAG